MLFYFFYSIEHCCQNFEDNMILFPSIKWPGFCWVPKKILGNPIILFEYISIIGHSEFGFPGLHMPFQYVVSILLFLYSVGNCFCFSSYLFCCFVYLFCSFMWVFLLQNLLLPYVGSSLPAFCICHFPFFLTS